MRSFKFIKTALLSGIVMYSCVLQASVSDIAKHASKHALDTYQNEMVESLRQLVKYNTVAVDGVLSTDNPVHQAFKRELAAQAKQLGLDYTDHGYVVIVGYGTGEERVGMIAHGDVQPVDPKKWAKSPFELDLTTEPGKLLGRGTEDDKAPISNALYAMKTIKDLNIQLKKRIELYVYMAEESDWQPLRDYIKDHSLPQINITLDSEYPVVTAEKGYGTISMTFPDKVIQSKALYLREFTGGFFGSQIPEDAQAVLANASATVVKELQQRAKTQQGMKYSFQRKNDDLVITALGKAAHSSKPEYGVNAITHLASLLDIKRWPNNAGGSLVNFINDNLGTALYGESFGQIAYQDDFMGPMSVQPTVLKKTNVGMELNINIRRPRGKTELQLQSEIEQVFTQWQQQNKVNLHNKKIELTDPFVQTGAPQIPTLLGVFSHYTGIENAQPISIGGGTNSRLFPNAVSFGPAMPGKEYTGHSEHEFITMEQFLLNLQMYTAVLVDLAK